MGSLATRGLSLHVFATLAILLAPVRIDAAPADEARVVLRFWNALIFEPPRSAVHEAVARFNEIDPEIYVEVLDTPLMEQKLLTAVVGRVPPDVALFDRFRVANYAHAGAFMTLDELANEAGIREEDFFDACWDECLYEDRLFAVPFNTDVRVLYYNRQLFREAGLDPDRPPRTWRELREYSRRLTKHDASGRLEQVGFVPFVNFGNTWLYLFGWQKGATYLSDDGRTAQLDDPRLLEALQWVTDFTADYGASALRSFQSGFASRELDPFLIGRMAMIGEEVFMLSRIARYAPDLDFSIAPLPWPEDGQRATWSGGFALVVPEGCEYPREAARFIAYMSGREGQLVYGTGSSQLPANRTAVDHPFYSGDPNWRKLIAEMEYSHFRPVTPAGAVMWQEMHRAWEYAASGRGTPEAALVRAQRVSQDELDRIYAVEELSIVNWASVALILGAGAILLVGARIRRSLRIVRSLTLHRREAIAGYLFAAPVLIGLAVFTIGPILVTIVFSLCQYDVLSPARWVGLKNYRLLLTEDPLFWKSLWNTIYFTVLAVPTALAGSLGLALLLNAPIKGRSFWRTLFYLPSIVPLVAMSLLFLWLFNDTYGLFNIFLERVGLPRVPWLTSPGTAKASLVLMNMWTIGAGMIIFLAGLQGIPRHLYESALIDGAGAWNRFLHVTLPLLSPTIFFMLIINTIGAFQVFTQAYLMTDGTGAPEDSTLFYVFHLFNQGFVYFNMGYASAMAWIMFLLIMAVAIFQWKTSKYWVFEENA